MKMDIPGSTTRRHAIWKIAPGSGADGWDECRDRGCIALGWPDMVDFRKFKTRSALDAALKRRPSKIGSNGAPAIWAFVHEMKIGDYVVANKGESKVVGIGRVASDYLPPEANRNPMRRTGLPHARRIDWLIDGQVVLGRRFFGPVPPVLKPVSAEQWQKIIGAYEKSHGGDAAKLRILRNAQEDEPASSALDADVFEEIAEVTGQRYLQNAALRRAVERYAMDKATAYFTDSGYDVHDLSMTEPYDLHCTKGESR